MITTSSRRIYRHAQLKRLFDPASVAIVGASPNPASFGARTLNNLHDYTGRIHLINAKYPSINGRLCVSSLTDLDESPDCVIVAVPRDGVEHIIEQAVQAKAGGAIIYASGFSETGKVHFEQLQNRIVALTQNTTTRLLGPNCLGAINAISSLHATFTSIPQSFRGGGKRSVGLISQSGALGVALSQAVERGVSFSHMLTSGNACDVDIADQIAYLAEDESCDVIACVFEGTSDPIRLIEAGDIARRNQKAVIVFKLAVGANGAEAALSHTGALAGSAAGYRALFERAGFVTVDRFEALIETACFFSKAPRVRANGVAVLSPSGGAGILAADCAEVHDVPLPQPGPELKTVLESHIPEFGAARNPCDVTAQILNNTESFPACAEAFLKDPAIGALVVPNILAHEMGAKRSLALGPMVQAHDKIACIYWLSEWLEGPGAKEIETNSNIALFRSADRCFKTIASWQDWWRKIDAGIRPSVPIIDSGARLRVLRELETTSPNAVIGESQSKRVLEAYGIEVVNEHLINTAEEAVNAASALGFPVALKVESSALPHKTEAGVIRLALKDIREVRQAFESITINALKVTSADTINGVLVQPMIPPGLEIMVGARVDPVLGPLIMVGMGGIMVELLKDTSVAIAPVNHSGAVAMLGRLKGRALLSGFRGSQPVDIDRLAECIVRISELIHDFRQEITEIDVNPLICAGSRIIAVDALIVRSALTMTEKRMTEALA